MFLGPYQLSNPFILAPMAGVSEMPFRRIALQLGAAAAPTELISAKGLLYGQARTQRYLTHHASEQPFWVQLFGGEPDVMAEGAAYAIHLGAKIIDINMGCPVPKVTKKGAGSALLCDLDRAVQIVDAIVKKTSAPVTIKVRSGWDDQHLNPTNLAQRFADVGCIAIAMHARTREQGYSGSADWSQIAKLVEHSPIPVIGNGDVRSYQDAQNMIAQTGVQGVMIGRAALGNPWIFQEMNLMQHISITPQAKYNLIREHLMQHIDFVGDVTLAIRRFRSHLMWYAKGLVGCAQFRNTVNYIQELEPLIETCEQFFLNAQNDLAPQEEEFDERGALG